MARIVRAFLEANLDGAKSYPFGATDKGTKVMKKSSGFLSGLRRFIRVEDGLVTVEWVALTAGMVVAAVAIGFVVMKSTATNATGIGNNISSEITGNYGVHGANLK